jgi:hypothetical protein
MRKAVIAIVTVAVIVSGCSISGLVGGKGNTAERVLADAGCLLALSNAAVTVAGDPAVGGAKTVMDVVSAINKVGASDVPATALSACAASLQFAEQDMAGALAAVKGSRGSDAPVVQAPPAGREMPRFAAPPRPTVVTVPIR